MSIRDYKTIGNRRDFIKKSLKIDLRAIEVYPDGSAKAQFTNCENMIGATQVPLGIAGPIFIKGNFAKGEYFIPLATTEGALIASVSRGCKVISQSGGTTVLIEDVGVTRGPVYKTSGIVESRKFKKWLEDHIDGLKMIASSTSKHLTLTKLEVSMVGRHVFVRYYFDTQEAMGMNMATIATTRINQFILEKQKIRCVSVAGNFDTDKKPAWLNIISGRGKKVWAEVMISKEVIRETLKTTAPKIHEVWLSKCMLGSIMAGSMGYNAHFANIIAAFFVATGQDVAHVAEGSLGITTTEVIEDNLYISILIPDFMVGTVGGGTNLPSQKEALSILGINRERGSSMKLAEILGAAVLAGEISLLAALSTGSLSSVHEQLARRKIR